MLSEDVQLSGLICPVGCMNVPGGIIMRIAVCVRAFVDGDEYERYPPAGLEANCMGAMGIGGIGMYPAGSVGTKVL